MCFSTSDKSDFLKNSGILTDCVKGTFRVRLMSWWISVEYAMVVYGLYRIRLMIRIAEQHEFIKVMAVTVCVKVDIGRKAGHK